MRSSPFFLAWGLLVLSVAGMAQYNGWSMTRINQVENVLRTVRDNPGAYRSTYGYYHRYIGGK